MLLEDFCKKIDAVPMSVIEDIKAEIEEHIKYNIKMNYMGVVSGLLISRDIINEYTGKERVNDSKMLHDNLCI